MRTIKFTAFLFYEYYSKGKNAIPYALTILALTMLSFIHAMQVLILLEMSRHLDIMGKGHDLKAYVRAFFVLSPLMVFFLVAIKKSDLEKAVYPADRLKKGRVCLVVYTVVTIAFLVFLIIYKKGLHWN